MAYSGALVLTWACCFSYAGSVSPLLRRAIDSKGEISSGPAEPQTNVTNHPGNPVVDLLVIIPSSVKELDKRVAVRHSWGKYIDSFGHCKRCNSSRTVKILFGVARPAEGDAGMVEQVEKEIEVFGDLAVLNLGGQADHYRNLTTKVRSFLEYALQHFRFGLLLKVDTDSFVFMDRFLSMAEQKKLFHPDTNSTNIYGGAFQSGARPDENPAGKWVDRTYRKLTGHELFPKYARGAGYVLSPPLCRYIAEGLPGRDSGDGDAWAGFPELQPLPNEDVSVGFWLEPIVHAKVELPISHLPIGCRDRSQIIDHHVLSRLMATRWKSLEETGDPCSAAAVSEETFEQVLTSKLDALNYSGRDRKSVV